MINRNTKFVLIFFLFFNWVNSNSQDRNVLFQVTYDQIIFPFFNYDYNQNEFSCRLSGQITYYFSNRVSIATGISYESNKYNVVYPYKETTALRITEENYKQTFIGIPLSFGFSILNRKTHTLSITSGFELKRLITDKVIFHFNDGSIRSGLDENSFYEYVNCFNIGVDYNYYINPYLFVGVSPKFRYNLSTYGKTPGDAITFSYLFQISFGCVLN